MTTTHTTTFTIYSTFLYLPVNVSTLHWSHQISGSVWSNAIGRFTWPSIVNIQCGSQKTVDFNNLYSLTMTAQKIHNHTSFSSSLLEPILLNDTRGNVNDNNKNTKSIMQNATHTPTHITMHS